MASRRPGLLTFVALVAIVIGIVTALTALSSVVVSELPFAQSFKVAPGGRAGPNAAVIAAQIDLQRRLMEIRQRRRGLFLAAAPFSLVAAGMMILGGARAFSLRRGSRPLLLAGMA